MNKSCKDCEFFWWDGCGYSDWTWLHNEARCFLGMNPDFPCEEVYVGEQPQFNFAEKCEKFYEAYGDKGNPPIVSPDGELSGGSMRAASLIRNGSK